MLQKFFTDILVNPFTGNKLIYDDHSQELTDSITKAQIKILENTPVFTDSFKEENKDDFQYVKHYNKDAAYNDYFEEEENKITVNERLRSRENLIAAVPKKTKLILDIGCGGAWVAAHFTQKNINVISLDVSERNPMQALKNNPNPHHAAVVSDSLHLPFQDASIDVIIASEVLEHLPEPALFVQQWLRVLKPGGTLLMITPYNEKRVFHTCIHCHELTPANAHLHTINEKNIRDYLPAKFSSLSTKAFSNKTFTKLRLYFLLRFLPFNIWETMDAFLNKVVKTPSNFLINLKK